MLVALCIHVLARSPSPLPPPPLPRVPASPALLAALDTRAPRVWALAARLLHPLPPRLHDIDLPLDHPDLPFTQRVPDAPDLALLVLLALPHCPHLRDDAVPRLRALPRLVALDLRGCPLSSYALVALARGLAADGPARSGTWGLRLLSLHGCPNIDDDVLPALSKFPLLSAVDLRYTRCTPSAVSASLSPLAFRPSDNRSLFHPAPLAVTLCTLEKLALAAPQPISLYSCPPQSVFRVHINRFSCPKKAAPDESTPARSDSASLFYADAPSRNSALPHTVQSPQTKLDPLAVARLPPPWKVLDACASPAVEPEHPSLDDPLRVDPARLHKRGSDAVADMVHQFARKRPKIESEFAKSRKVPPKPRNPFASTARDDPVHGGEPPTRLRVPSMADKPLKPITTLKPPILPRELLPSSSAPKPNMKQTRLTFARGP